MIRIQIAQVPSRRTGENKTTGKHYDFTTQVGYAYTVDKDGNPPLHPEKFEFFVDGGGYPPGDYTLHPSAFYVKDGKLSFMPNRLAPVKPKS